MQQALRDTYDVVIVGYGPTGATLANLLGRCGISTLVLEREATAYHLPRAVHFDDEVMRVFQSAGVADDVAATTRVNPGMRFVDSEGRLLLDWPRPQEVGPHGWHASYRFHQPDLERILRDAAGRFAHVDVKTRAAVTGTEDGDGRVLVHYDDRVDGHSRTVAAGYVVGCDGANSLIRNLIGTGFDDFGFDERWLVLDALLKRPKPELGDHTMQYCVPARPATYVRGPGNRRRWEITVLDHEASDDMVAPDAVWRLLRPWITPDDAELERAAVYTFQSKVAITWRHGRLLIAGDAAHLTPPFMGQGMCAGVRDAANLAWKLALVVQGRAPDSLLDSYQDERRPHARTYIETAVRLGGLINTCGTEDALRAAFKQPDGSARMESIKPKLGPGLRAGRDDWTGTMFPQPVLEDGRHMDDVVGLHPVLAIDAGLLASADAAVSQTLTDKGIIVIADDKHPAVRQPLAAFGGGAVLVRPDRYVLGTAHDATELRDLLAGTPPSPH